MAKIIDGKKIAAEIRGELKSSVSAIKEKTGVVPGIAVLLIGDNPASKVYVSMKEKACKELGIYSEKHLIDKTVTTEELIKKIEELNNSSKIHGVLVQLPLPDHVCEKDVLEAVSVDKDVDCFHPYNVGRMLIGNPAFLPCTPAGVQELLVRSGISPEGKNVVIIGRSNIVGKPLFSILCQKAKNANATVSMCHSRTKNLHEIASQADILIAAIGRPEFVKAGMVKPGAVVIDVGVNRVEDTSREKGYRLTGDVDFEAVKEKASAITPVPGGVGPMTIAMLMKNTVAACRRQLGMKEND
ncbi:MAG: bifunctional methylenetetrahydrofolate dehydrogenase/methenyltetrahydrofolate cyclohydrolase FolD [Candidatus Aureabacteria bacterium]|nr:bifunctional methylenetetrahydrofolate dehydrogenase/methenyltetrahydrofolate cyclohydrolase FolD [Candidatus Auribacterota bacterium]